MKRRLFRLVVFLIFCYSETLAEVMDKEPSYEFIWAWCFIALFLAYFIYKYHYYLSFIFIPISLVFPVACIGELNDKVIGTAIMQEAGIIYFVNIYLSVFILILIQVLFIIKFRRNKKVAAA